MTGLSPRLSPADLLAALLVIIIWGVNFVPTKFALAEFTPFQLGAARFLLAALPLLLLVRRPKMPWQWVLLFALTQGVGQFGFLFFSLSVGMTAALASVLMQTQIFITALLGVVLLGEAISRTLKIAMAIAACGLVCFAVNVALGSGLSGVTAAGFMLCLTAASLWAGSNIVAKKIQATQPGYSPLSLVVWSNLISGLLFVVIAWLVDDPARRWDWLQASPKAWVSVLFLSWVASGIAYWLWAVLLSRHPASRVAPFSLGVPVIGLLAGILVLQEQVTAWQWLGALLVMSALVFLMLSSNRLVRRYFPPSMR